MNSGVHGLFCTKDLPVIFRREKSKIMKRILIIAALLLAAVALQAQIRFGIKAGANFYKFSGKDASFGSDYSPKFNAGFAGGGLVNIPVNEMFSVQGEVLYSMEGSRYNLPGEDVIEKTDYINIPVLFQYNVSGFYAETGPQVGFIVRAKETQGSESADTRDEFTSANFSWALGLGYKMSNGIGFGARYNIGIVDITKNPDFSVKVGGFHVGVFYLFGGNKK